MLVHALHLKENKGSQIGSPKNMLLKNHALALTWETKKKQTKPTANNLKSWKARNEPGISCSILTLPNSDHSWVILLLKQLA